MSKCFHEDILFVELLGRKYRSAIQVNLSDIEIDELLVKGLSAYTEESLNSEASLYALKILSQLCLCQSNKTIKWPSQEAPVAPGKEKPSYGLSSLIRIAVRFMLNNGYITPCLSFFAEHIKGMTDDDRKSIISEINLALNTPKLLKFGNGISHQTLDLAINLNNSYIDYILKTECLTEEGPYEENPYCHYIEKITNIINGKQSSSQRLTSQARINKLFSSNIPHLTGINSTENTDECKIAICTHHKCGTSFLLKTITAISKASNLKVWRKYYEPTRYTNDDWDIVLEQHSRVHDINQYLKGIHCIRRPESLIFSATFYHQKAKEPWLDVPLEKFDHNIYRAFTTGKIYNLINDGRIEDWRKKEIVENYQCDEPIPYHFESQFEFNGRSYREMLNSFESLEDKLRFEMQCYSLGVISDMLNFDSKNFYTLKLEDASFNPRMNQLYEAFKFVGFWGDLLDSCMNVCSDHILALNPDAAGQHGTTKLSNDWEQIFTGNLKSFYYSLYADSAQLLGYNE